MRLYLSLVEWRRKTENFKCSSGIPEKLVDRWSDNFQCATTFHSVTMDQWDASQRAFVVKSFYKKRRQCDCCSI